MTQTPLNTLNTKISAFPDLTRRKYYELQKPKYISWEFYSKYSDRQPPFGELGVIVYLRTYSRFVEELDRREHWSETVLRVVEYSLSLEDLTPVEDKRKEAEALFEMIFNMRGFPAGRTLWVGDRNRQIPSTANFNCSFRTIDSISAYAEIMYLLMVGAGAGFSVESKYVKDLPQFNTAFKVNHIPYTKQEESDRQDDTRVEFFNTGNHSYNECPSSTQYFTESDLTTSDDDYLVVDSQADHALLTIGDSRAGWVHGLWCFFTLLTYPQIKHITIDYSLIREKGKRLKTFGGRASGYEPLKQFFKKAEWIIKNCGGNLASVSAMDLANIIAEVVVVAGVRRSSELSVGDSWDVAFKTAKYKLFNYNPGITCGTDDLSYAQCLADTYSDFLGKFTYNIVNENEVVVYTDDAQHLEIERLSRDRICKEIQKITLIPDVSPLDGYKIRIPDASSLEGYSLQALLSDCPDLLDPVMVIGRQGLLPLLTKTYDIWDTKQTGNLEAQKIVDTLDPKFRYRDSRVMSNNSLALQSKPSRTELEDLIQFIRDNGEPGLLNYETGRKRRADFQGVNPCAEILLQNRGVCNLVEGVLPAYVQEDGTFNWQVFESDLRLLTRMASRITLVDMWHPEWDKVQKSDRLLGVSLTGQCDAWNLLGNPPESFQNSVLAFAKDIARDEEEKYHNFLGIPRAILVTTGKPSGSISQIPTCSSGCHQPYAPYYFRTIRISSFDPIAKALKDLGCKVDPQKASTLEEDDTWVFTFPIKTSAKFKSVDESAIAQLQRYKNLMQNFVEHNQSVTISVAPDEWDSVVDWLDDQENWESFVGISFLPKFDPTVGTDGSYPRMPYVTCSEEQYNELLPQFPLMSEDDLISLIRKYEKSEEEYVIDDACSTGACPIR